jgi:hypothetical protein
LLARSNDSALFIGVVDGAGATRDPDIRAALAENNVPALVLQPDTLVAAEDRAKVRKYQNKLLLIISNYI